jgi:hypothetical protein
MTGDIFRALATPGVWLCRLGFVRAGKLWFRLWGHLVNFYADCVLWIEARSGKT